MGRTKLAQEIILEELRHSQVGKKELKKLVQAKNPSLTNEHVKKALSKLIDAGDIVRDGKIFRIPSKEDVTEHPPPSADEDQVVPIGMRLRKQITTNSKSVKFADEEVDIDDEIRRLEMELINDSSGDESDDDSPDDTEGDDATPAVLSLSAYAQDRIEHLPESCLPEPGKYNPRGASKIGTKGGPVKKKEGSQQLDGLKEAVQEVLNGYKARSSERLPFYCRFCSKQYGNEKEFFEHKNSEFHKTAVELERKATYCRLCLKQLTSPEQMKEHLSSRPHREKLKYVKSRQKAEPSGKRKRDSSERQWT